MKRHAGRDRRRRVSRSEIHGHDEPLLIQQSRGRSKVKLTTDSNNGNNNNSNSNSYNHSPEGNRNAQLEHCAVDFQQLPITGRENEMRMRSSRCQVDGRVLFERLPECLPLLLLLLLLLLLILLLLLLLLLNYLTQFN